ncbi:GH25 family lysozyme [Micromonospora sp. WMMD998]|uniref:GH25 family lysozyme n=1 Tax=Micromonospora sp. WMMD998 TaxID=3016092 RepID=UPI00249CB04C|nr:GH25 family lysozyme [Micromonospora sp. WMMD998]WFE37255.1 GH25 family lysozyme [Micromonospora sp. WMMD998]
MSRRWISTLAAAGLVLGAALGTAAPAGAAGATPDGDGRANAGVRPGARVSSVSAKAAVPAGYTIQGVDVASHDHNLGPIDWPALAAQGYKFAYVKATEGETYLNPYFAEDYAAAKAAGLLVGAYHFTRPDGRNPIVEANFFADNARFAKDAQTLVPMIDVEWPYWDGAPTCYGLTPAETSAWLRAFTDQLQARFGRPVMIYTNANYWNPCTGNDASFGNHPLDIAGYTATRPALPAGWSTETIWQYAPGDASKPASYSQNVFNGDYPTLTQLTGAPVPAAPVAFRARANNKIVSADSAGNKPLIANRDSVGAWEQFDVVDAGGGLVALRARVNGKYVSADSAGNKPLIANRAAVGAWETFTIVDNADGTVSLRATVNGGYVSADSAGNKPLIANRTTIGAWEKFDRLPVA